MSIGISILLSACGSREQEFQDISGRRIVLPDGTPIQAEVKADRQSQATGMMYRSSLPKNHGMLFVYRAPVREAYWMHNVQIPLDIIWLDKDGKVVEEVPSAPPCQREPKDCPSFGGHELASYVLELNAGQGRAHGIAAGKVVRIS